MLLTPQSIAIIGASAQPGKVGHDVLKNLKDQGYAGKLFPVNPKGGEILGITAYVDIAALPEAPDLAIVITPAATVAGILLECATKGTKNIVVISAGFKETGTDEGKAREAELATIAREHGLTLIGPNCLGILRPQVKMNASFAKDLPPAGGIALVSQSGAFAVALLDAAAQLKLGFSAVVSVGNKTVTDECDLIELLAQDPETTVIGLYLENINDGRRFREVAKRVGAIKPIVLIKAGVSSFGARAASSHTGALAGNTAAIDAVCAQANIHRATTLEEFTDLLRVLSSQPGLVSRDIAIITNAGGPGILASDAAERVGLNLPRLTSATEAELRKALPPTASTGNPIDVIGDAGLDRYQAALQACIDDPGIDGIAVLLTPQVMTPCAEVARAVVAAKRTTPLVPMTASFMGGASVEEARSILADAGIPTFDTPERAIAALAALRPHTHDNGTSAPIVDAGRRRDAHALLAGSEGLIDESRAQRLFTLYDLPTPHQGVAHDPEEAGRIAADIGMPLVAKVSSPDILHKTDIGGVRVGIKTPEEAVAAYGEIEKNVREHMPQARWNGVLLQRLLPPGDEFIIGGVRDPSFGPLVMVGLGGIYTELFRDTCFRMAPVSEAEAYAMLTQLKAWKLLLGMRGKAQRDIAALARTLVQVGLLLEECPQIAELDCNPVIVNDGGVSIADVKVVVQTPKTSR